MDEPTTQRDDDADIVTVIYKSGAKVHIRCQGFKLTTRGAGLGTVTWSNSAKPWPMFIGVDDIAAIYEGRA